MSHTGSTSSALRVLAWAHVVMASMVDSQLGRPVWFDGCEADLLGFSSVVSACVRACEGTPCLFRGLSLFTLSICGGIQTTSKKVAACQEQVGRGAFRICQAQNLPPCAE